MSEVKRYVCGGEFAPFTTFKTKIEEVNERYEQSREFAKRQVNALNEEKKSLWTGLFEEMKAAGFYPADAKYEDYRFQYNVSTNQLFELEKEEAAANFIEFLKGLT